MYTNRWIDTCSFEIQKRLESSSMEQRQTWRRRRRRSPAREYSLINPSTCHSSHSSRETLFIQYCVFNNGSSLKRFVTPFPSLHPSVRSALPTRNRLPIHFTEDNTAPSQDGRVSFLSAKRTGKINCDEKTPPLESLTSSIEDLCFG